jgi:hypothetical protein
MAEATLVLAEVARRYRIAHADDSPVLPVGILTTQPNRRVLFRLDPHEAPRLACGGGLRGSLDSDAEGCSRPPAWCLERLFASRR